MQLNNAFVNKNSAQSLEVLAINRIFIQHSAIYLLNREKESPTADNRQATNSPKRRFLFLLPEKTSKNSTSASERCTQKSERSTKKNERSYKKSEHSTQKCERSYKKTEHWTIKSERSYKKCERWTIKCERSYKKCDIF